MVCPGAILNGNDTHTSPYLWSTINKPPVIKSEATIFFGRLEVFDARLSRMSIAAFAELRMTMGCDAAFRYMMSPTNYMVGLN